MTTRPYLNYNIEQLEELFGKSKTDARVLRTLLDELSVRKTSRAKKLRAAVDEHLARKPTGSANTKTAISANPAPAAAAHVDKLPTTENREAIPVTAEDRLDVSAWDPEQKVVIELDEESASLVEAGPGAGKTAVACARVARLVEDCDIEPSKILLVSFTRAAVKELRDRIESYAKHPINISGLNIATLDSFTWQVVRGITGEDARKLLEGYEGNIRKFIELLQSGNHDLLDYLAEMRHIVIDEGQDLVAERADLAVELIRHLPEGCGVTVFADSAQAIYGFTDDMDGRKNGGSRTLAERIYDKELNFEQFCQLHGIHRTKDERLIKLYRLGREKLLECRESAVEDWKVMKQDIEELSHRKIGKLDELGLKDRSDVLVLFRTRAEALMQSSMLWAKGVENKLRMSGIAARIHPWVGRVFGSYCNDHITREDFDALWVDRIGEKPPLATPAKDEVWELLLDNAGERRDKVDVRRLREILSRDNPPVDFIMDERSLPGPVIGTIHASKGREADHVFLMLPSDDYMNNKQEPHQIAEEERVLFVGATRARHELVTGPGFRAFASRLGRTGRTYRIHQRSNGPAAQMEIGRKEDFDPVSVADSQITEISARQLQEWLWMNANKDFSLLATYDRIRKANILSLVDGSKRIIGVLSKEFSFDLFELAKIVGNKHGRSGLYPHSPIQHIRMVGARTVVIAPASRELLREPWRQSGFLLVPVISAFTQVYFRSKRSQ